MLLYICSLFYMKLIDVPQAKPRLERYDNWYFTGYFKYRKYYKSYLLNNQLENYLPHLKVIGVNLHLS